VEYYAEREGGRERGSIMQAELRAKQWLFN